VMDAPVLLVPTDYIPGSVITELGRIAPQRTIIVGGTKAVSTEVEGYLNEMLGAANVDRIGGTSRYDTAALVARRMMHVRSDQGLAWDGSYFLSSGANFPDALLDYSRIAVATGQSFPDAMTSGVRQAKNGSVLVLTPGTSLDPGVVDLIAQEGMTEVREVTFIGGASAISQEVRETLAMRLAAMEN
jgi:hypothetical protein